MDEAINAPDPLARAHETFARWDQRLDRLQADIVSGEQLGTFPDWWHNEPTGEYDAMREIIDLGGKYPELVPQYYQLAAKNLALQQKITGHEADHPLYFVTSLLGSDMVGKAFTAEPDNGVLHQGMLDRLATTHPMDGKPLTRELKMLQAVYGTESMTDLLGLRGTPYTDQLGKLLRTTPKALQWMSFNEQPQDLQRTMAPEERLRVKHEWMAKAVAAAAGITQAEALDYTFSAVHRFGGTERALPVIAAFDHFGAERMRKITKFTNIYAVDMYTTEQLERMERLVDDPVGEAKRLAKHDVAVVLVNRFGDDDGTMSDIADNFDDEGKRTLYFEFTRMGDIYRKISALHQLGVTPSVIVLAAHSARGQFIVSDLREVSQRRMDIATIAGRAFVRAANDSEEIQRKNQRGYSLHGMKGLARMVNNYMQPSRELDDAEEDRGRIKFIFQACHAADDTEVKDLDEDGNKRILGMESVIGRLGKDLIAYGVRTPVDIYGGSGGIQVHRNDTGVHYSQRAREYGGERIPIDATRIRIEDGTFTKDHVKSVTLRKVPNQRAASE